MKEFSKEVIEIGGVEYTLFLNRAGMVAIEKFTREEKQKIETLQSITANLETGGIAVIDDNTDPLEGLEAVESATTLEENIYKKCFWIMLSSTHKLNYSDSCKLYEQAIEEYGGQVNKLIDQIVYDIETDKVTLENKNVKNLKALRPTN